MRERLTVAFVVLTVTVLLVVGVVRAFTLRELIEERESVTLDRQARLVAVLVGNAERDGDAVTPAFLQPMAVGGTSITVERTGLPPVSVADPGYDPSDPGSDTVGRESLDQATVTVRQSEAVVRDVLGRNLGSLAALLLMLLLFAGVVGFVLAGYLSRPFVALAESAEALGRGRFDLELPRSSIPEAAAIATSLMASSGRLEDSIKRDRAFFHHASHVLRTPLTGMRLEIEDLSLRSDLPQDVRRTASRCVGEVQRLDGVVDDLLEFARGRSLVAGAEISLAALGSRIAQHWRDQLPESIEVRAYVDGGGDARLTPGPVEQLLDQVLAEVTSTAAGPVSLRFAGQPEHVRIRIEGGRPRNGGSQGHAGSESALAMVEALGGRLSGEVVSATGLEILLPRR
ncbi:HAMP domain-containing sensor histidine kinase [uncultured Nocardioides sp.]|uniref:histidine kinase n=1 Tax=uncultured Nocardioides sp. TaxID=198441 RepID=A0A6J4NXN1_9ACTN|nr:HAMP domain-containing sensor histidine kinase [uncultured Nocardioides sp.]CAA9400403.1 MAG: Two-component system sensor histidine kinase [uncultured Nocardioides sp.]